MTIYSNKSSRSCSITSSLEPVVAEERSASVWGRGWGGFGHQSEMHVAAEKASIGVWTLWDTR